MRTSFFDSNPLLTTNPIDRYEKPVTRIGQQAVSPGTKPTLGWAYVLEAERGHFVKVLQLKIALVW